IDYFPKATGRRGGIVKPGQILKARMCFLPAANRLRAIMDQPAGAGDAPGDLTWPLGAPDVPPSLADTGAFWIKSNPIVTGPGRIRQDPDTKRYYWCALDIPRPVPILNDLPADMFGVDIAQAICSTGLAGTEIWAARLNTLETEVVFAS
ncbi:MAG: hypothetical protein AAF701_08335, partial [Pseudomonadota bacterium]